MTTEPTTPPTQEERDLLNGIFGAFTSQQRIEKATNLLRAHVASRVQQAEARATAAELGKEELLAAAEQTLGTILRRNEPLPPNWPAIAARLHAAINGASATKGTNP